MTQKAKTNPSKVRSEPAWLAKAKVKTQELLNEAEDVMEDRAVFEVTVPKDAVVVVDNEGVVEKINEEYVVEECKEQPVLGNAKINDVVNGWDREKYGWAWKMHNGICAYKVPRELRLVDLDTIIIHDACEMNEYLRNVQIDNHQLRADGGHHFYLNKDGKCYLITSPHLKVSGVNDDKLDLISVHIAVHTEANNLDLSNVIRNLVSDIPTLKYIYRHMEVAPCKGCGQVRFPTRQDFIEFLIRGKFGLKLVVR